MDGVAKKKDLKLSKEDKAAQLLKWNESCWKMLVYIVLVAVCLGVSCTKPWFADSSKQWEGATQFPLNQYVTRGMLWCYYLELGYYIQAVPFLIFIEVRRKDWLESMAHHLVTLFLLYYALYANFARVGIIVMLLHDVSDIFLEAAKLARYGGKQDLALGLFVTFTISWFILRLILYPQVIVHNCLTKPVSMIAMPYNINPQPHYSLCGCLFLILLFLHIYWTYFIVMVIVRQLRSGDVADVREEDD